MAKACKVILVWCCAVALLAVAFAADAETETTVDKILNAPRRILRGLQGPHAWSGGGGRFGPAMWPGSYGGGWGGWGMMGMMWPYQENRWVSASRMDNSVERRFNMAQ